MLHSISKKIQLLCENSKNVVLGFLIEPICKRRYCFIIFKANNQMSLLMGSHDTTEFLDFIKAYVPEGCSFSEFHNRIAVSEPLVSNIKLGKMNKPVAPVYKTIKQCRSDRCGVFICVRFVCV